MKSPLALIVAMARGGVIGRGGRIPWRLPEDMRHFKRVTTGHAVIMGRKTYEDIGRPLPNRRNIVVTRNAGLRLEGCEIARGVDEAVALAREGDEEPFIIGGAEIYRLALPDVTRMHVTYIDREIAGDAIFPEYDRTAFREVERRAGESPEVTFVTLERVQ